MSANDMDELQAVAGIITDERISASARDGFDTLLQQALRSSWCLRTLRRRYR
jgi:hypothetical protein